MSSPYIIILSTHPFFNSASIGNGLKDTHTRVKKWIGRYTTKGGSNSFCFSTMDNVFVVPVYGGYSLEVPCSITHGIANPFFALTINPFFTCYHIPYCGESPSHLLRRLRELLLHSQYNRTKSHHKRGTQSVNKPTLSIPLLGFRRQV